MKFSYIPKEAISRVPRALQYLKTVEPYLLPRSDAFNLYMKCVSGEAALWGGFADNATADTLDEHLVGVAVTRITNYPNGDMLTITALAADEPADEFLDLAYATLTDFWKKNGLLGVEEWGRDGWVRRLRKYGFRKSFVLMEDFDGEGLRSQPHDLDGNAEHSA